MEWDLDKISTTSFASDNNSGTISEALEALTLVNDNHVAAYGNDPITAKTRELFKKKFGPKAETIFVFNGTAANILCLRALLKSYQGVICAETSHLNNDEGGAPEHTLGTKLLQLPSPDGKIKAQDIKKHFIRLGDPHRVQPKVVSITQPTELGTLYTIEEMREIADEAHKNGLYLHIDGSRLVNAAQALNVSLQEITEGVGADAVSFGGTKNGLMLAEACVFFDKKFFQEILFHQKQYLQMPGKCRYVAAQFYAFLKNDIWEKYSENSNQMAQRLAQKFEGQPGFEITQKVQTNAVFIKIPRGILNEVRKKYFFYIWDEKKDEARWMTTFNTTPEQVDDFAATVLRAAENTK